MALGLPAMNTFFATKFRIEEGYGVGSYSFGHILYLVALLLIILTLGPLYRRSDWQGRKRIRYTLASLVLIDEVLKYIIPIATDSWSWSFLPLHLCSLSVYTTAIHAFTNSDKVAEALYAISLPTALMALIFPNWMMLPCWNWESIHSFTIHMILVIYPCMLLYGGFRPQFSRLRYAILPLVIAIAVAVVANHFLDTNFFFLNGGDSGNPLSFLEHYVGGWYILAFPLIAAILWLGRYGLPYLVRRRGEQGSRQAV